MQQYPEGQALQVALSAYNTGNFVQGFRNGYVGKVLRNMPDKAQMQTAETSTGVQPIPLADAAHKPKLAEVIRPKPATAQPATVTVEKPIEEQAKKMSAIGGISDKAAPQIEPSINVYSEANHQGVMVYSQ